MEVVSWIIWAAELKINVSKSFATDFSNYEINPSIEFVNSYSFYILGSHSFIFKL